MTSKRKIALIILSISIIILMSLGTYSFFSALITGNTINDNVVQTTGTIQITYEDSQTINASNLNPGDSREKTIKVLNTGSYDASYELVWESITNNFIDQNELVYELTCTSNQSTCDDITKRQIPSTSTNQVIENNINLKQNEEHTYILKITFLNLDKPQESNIDVTFNGKINVYESGTHDLKPEVDIVDNMIPVSWDGSTLIKVDNNNQDDSWYDYDNQKWANAVLVTEESRETIKSADVGTTIAESDILAYYTYVPRYKYLLWNANNNENCLNDNCDEQEIKVMFERKTTPKSTGSKNGQWLTHPAFTFGDSELNGIWVGKFATSPDTESACYTSPSTANCNLKSISLRVKPNLDMWTYVNTATIFSVTKQMETNAIYGLNNYDNAESHMMKNMEWGAVAYLSHSKYGKYGNNNYIEENKQLYINNYRQRYSPNKTLTGCSGGSPDAAINNTSCPHPYPNLTLEALGASTTGNIYGIYDMSGGVSDLVMGNIVQEGTELGTFYAGSSSGTWDEVPELKYYDSYEYDTHFLTHGRGHLGDATRETLKKIGTTNGGWYGDYTFFPVKTLTWFLRGGHAGNGFNDGAFSFAADTGAPNYLYGFRVVLAIE